MSLKSSKIDAIQTILPVNECQLLSNNLQVNAKCFLCMENVTYFRDHSERNTWKNPRYCFTFLCKQCLPWLCVNVIIL